MIFIILAAAVLDTSMFEVSDPPWCHATLKPKAPNPPGNCSDFHSIVAWGRKQVEFVQRLLQRFGRGPTEEGRVAVVALHLQSVGLFAESTGLRE